MKKLCILILVSFFATNSLDKAESVQLEETPHKIIDEIFGEGWWDNDKDKEWNKLTLEQTLDKMYQIDRQNTQIGQIEPNSTDQNNPPLTKSDHSDNANSNENVAEDEQKRKIIDKFNAMKYEFKQKGKYSKKEWVQIEKKIAEHLIVYRTKIYEWKKEFGLSQKRHNYRKEKEERKNLIEKFDQTKAELKRDGIKNSQNELDKTVAKELGLSFVTIYNWKRALGQTEPNKYPHSEQTELMKRYYEIKGTNLKISDKDIARMLKIGRVTLSRWKKQFKRQQFYPNSIDKTFCGRKCRR